MHEAHLLFFPNVKSKLVMIYWGRSVGRVVGWTTRARFLALSRFHFSTGSAGSYSPSRFLSNSYRELTLEDDAGELWWWLVSYIQLRVKNSPWPLSTLSLPIMIYWDRSAGKNSWQDGDISLWDYVQVAATNRPFFLILYFGILLHKFNLFLCVTHTYGTVFSATSPDLIEVTTYT
jgi:hypothetical protein